MKYVIKCRARGEVEWDTLTTYSTPKDAESAASRWVDNFPWSAEMEIKVFEVEQ